MALVLAAPVFAQSEETFPSYIQVNGRSEKEITPDEFYLSILINEQDSKGKITVETQQQQMITALKRLGINVEKQLKMADLSSAFFKKNSTVSSASYQLLLHSAAEVSTVYAALDGLGISNIAIQKVSHTMIEQYKEQVRVDAVRNAQTSAQTLAQALGQKIGKCFYIYDSNNNITPSYFDGAVLMRSASPMNGEGTMAKEASLDFKTIKLEYYVQTKFVLE